MEPRCVDRETLLVMRSGLVGNDVASLAAVFVHGGVTCAALEIVEGQERTYVPSPGRQFFSGWDGDRYTFVGGTERGRKKTYLFVPSSTGL